MKLTPEYLDNLIQEMVSAKSTRIVEREMPFKQDKEDVTKTLQLPKFALSEKWGDPASDDRQIIERFFSNIQGDTLQEKISSVQTFIKDCDESCIQESKVETIIANLVFLDSLAGVIEDFNNQTGGFMFEAFFKGYKTVSGSVKNLKNGVERFQKPITYIIGQKERQDKSILGVDFYQFTVGDESQGIKGDYDITQFANGDIKTNKLPNDMLIARLDFGSREQLKGIANKYVVRLGQRVTDIFDAFANLTNNLNIYLTDFENKTIGAQAAADADKLAKSVEKNID
jgi:hypothetical protein